LATEPTAAFERMMLREQGTAELIDRSKPNSGHNQRIDSYSYIAIKNEKLVG